MRLVCPNCDAQYEVDDSAIPAAGRDVQCSACGHGWFQQAPESRLGAGAPAAVQPPPDLQRPPPRPPAAEASDSPPPVAPPPRRPLDENVMAVLREEALREALARRAEAARSAAAQLPAAKAAMPGAAAPEPVLKASPAAPGPVPGPVIDPPPELHRPAPRRELLPDVEEINSTLSASSDRLDAASGPTPEDAQRGFRRGFLLMLALCALIALGYAMAPEIAARFPATAPVMLGYVAMVDGLRLDLNRAINGLGNSLQAIRATAE